MLDHPTHPFIGLPPPKTELDSVDVIPMTLMSHPIIEPLRALSFAGYLTALYNLKKLLNSRVLVSAVDVQRRMCNHFPHTCTAAFAPDNIQCASRSQRGGDWDNIL
jgi:hypothetical protein